MSMYDLDVCRRCGVNPVGHQEDYCSSCMEEVLTQTRVDAQDEDDDVTWGQVLGVLGAIAALWLATWGLLQWLK